MATNLLVRVNITDATASYASQPTYYITVDLAADRIIWTAGSAEVYNHCGYSPSNAQLNEAATLIQATPVIIDKCFLDDVSSVNKLEQLVGCKDTNDRYVFCFSFDGATATEPTLEAWDTSAHSAATLNVLGAGTPANSMVHAICTTAGAPGSSWSGTSLAAANTVLLNNGSGALGSATDLYANIYIKIPASYGTPETSQPVFSVRYTYS